MKYIKLVINKTARPMGNNIDWQSYDQQVKEFDNLKDAKKYLDDEYYYVKTIKKLYHDDKNGNAVHSGWIYCFKSDPVSYDDCKHYEQHWISAYKINSKPILIK